MKIECGEMSIFVYSEHWGFRKESVRAPINLTDISSQLHTADAENATIQVSTAQLVDFTNGDSMFYMYRMMLGIRKQIS